jgi:hypothetical protein
MEQDKKLKKGKNRFVRVTLREEDFYGGTEGAVNRRDWTDSSALWNGL